MVRPVFGFNPLTVWVKPKFPELGVVKAPPLMLIKYPVELEIESQLNVMLLLVVVPHVTCGVEIGGITLMFEITEAVSLHPFVFPITLMVLIGLVNTVVKNGDGLF